MRRKIFLAMYWVSMCGLVGGFLWMLATCPKRDDPIENAPVIVAGKMYFHQETMHQYQLLERQFSPFFPGSDSVTTYRVLLYCSRQMSLSGTYETDSVTYARLPSLGSALVLYEGTGYCRGTYTLYCDNAPRDRRTWIVHRPE